MRSDIVVTNLTKSFGEVTAVSSLDLDITQGEVFGLLGPNGAGKSTTISILCGLIEPSSGSASVGGEDVVEASSKVKEAIGVCTQSASVLPHLTGMENVVLFGQLHGLSKKKAGEQAAALLRRMGLSADQGRRAGKYSEGMKKRLSLALALVGDPRIVFLDEPTAAMDPQARRAVWDVVRELKQEGRTVVLTTHYIEEAEMLCDRVGIIDHGRLIALGAPADLIEQNGKKDLEEVFIHLTGRSIREGAE